MKTVTDAGMPRAIVYTRVSTVGQAEQGTSLDEQFAACTKKAKELGARIVAHEEDAGVSGATYTTREGMQNAISAIERKEADTLIIANLSRFSRDREHQTAIQKRVKAAGGRLVFCDMDFADTPEGDLAFGILGTFADYERKVIRERTVKGRRRRAEEGQQVSRSVSPYGYHIVTSHDVIAGRYPADLLGKYIIKEEEACHVRFMFERYAEGWSLYRIAKHLFDTGVSPARSNLWYAESVRAILRNPVHKGQPGFGATESIADESRREKGLRKLYYTRPAPEEKIVRLSAPAIVSEDLWEKAQERFAYNQQSGSGRRDRRWFLTGLLRCPLCNRNMSGRLRRPKFGRSHYGCRCSHPSLSADHRGCYPYPLYQEEVEPAVTEGIQALATGRVSLERAYDVFVSDDEGEHPIYGEEREAKAIIAALSALNDREKATITAQIAAIQAGADPKAFDAVFGEIRDERERLCRRRDALAIVTDRPKVSKAEQIKEAQEIVATAATVVKELLSAEELSPAERQGLLSKVVHSIVPAIDGVGDDGKPTRPTRVEIFLHGSGNLTVNVISISLVK